MDDNKHVIFHLIFVVLAIIIGFYIYKNYEEYSYYSELDAHGITTEAQIVEKPPDQSFHTIYYDQADKQFNKTFSVSSAMYDKYGAGDSISVKYMEYDPNISELSATATSSKSILKLILYVIISILVFAVAIPWSVGMFLIKRGSKNPPSRRQLNISELKCPECAAYMKAGYIPITGAIAWRNKNEPVGFITNLSGLPGTVWVNPFARPKLPGFHCPNCQIILFKYGK